MTISKNDRKELVNYWLEKADESFESAKSELNNYRLSFTINRLYYSLFYAMSAILIAAGKTYSKHSGVRASLHKDYIKTGIIDKEFGKLYDELFNDRHQADYTPMIEFDENVVLQQLIKVKKAIIKFKKVATSSI